MKTLTSILLVVATSSILQAQDTIYTKSGTTIPAKVYEVTQNEIRYQKASNLEGPIYTIDKTNVSLIEYKNGTKDVFGTDQSQANQAQQSQPNQNSNTYSKDGSYYGDDVYNQGQSSASNYTSSNYSNYNSGTSLSFMFGINSMLWGVPYYAGPWGGWPYYSSYYQPYWAYNYYRPWGGYAYGGFRGGYYGGGYGWRGGYRGGYYGGRGGYGWRGSNNHIGGGYYGGPRGGNGGFHGGFNGGGGFHGGNNGGFHGGNSGGFHGGGGGGFHGGGGGGGSHGGGHGGGRGH